MELFQSIVAARVLFVLGIINLVGGILIFLSCRCLSGSAILSRVRRHPFYQRLFSYHCYIWWIFWLSVIVHAILGIGLLGNPFVG